MKCPQFQNSKLTSRIEAHIGDILIKFIAQHYTGREDCKARALQNLGLVSRRGNKCPVPV